MAVSTTSTAYNSTRIVSHVTKRLNEFRSFLQQSRCPTGRRKRSWSPEQLTDSDYLKVPASVWRNIHDPTRMEYMDAADNTLTSALAAGALLSRPIVGLVKVHKWFWDKSIETKGRKDTYRYRVIDQATNITILPENEWYDPVEDDENKIKILFVGLSFKDHVILLLRRICPDANMDPIKSADQWGQYFLPSIRQGFSQVKRSTTYGWAPLIKRKKGRKNHRRRTSAASPRSKKSSARHVAK